MTNLEAIKTYDRDKMIEFLYHLVKNAFIQFDNFFIMPTKIALLILKTIADLEANRNMTNLEVIKTYDRDKMADFLYHLIEDAFIQFGNFVMPTKEGIIEFLDRECSY